MVNDLIMFIEEKNENNGKWSDHVYRRENENNGKWSDHGYKREKRK